MPRPPKPGTPSTHEYTGNCSASSVMDASRVLHVRSAGARAASCFDQHHQIDIGLAILRGFDDRKLTSSAMALSSSLLVLGSTAPVQW